MSGWPPRPCPTDWHHSTNWRHYQHGDPPEGEVLDEVLPWKREPRVFTPPRGRPGAALTAPDLSRQGLP
jgi:hypothetical protein